MSAARRVVIIRIVAQSILPPETLGQKAVEILQAAFSTHPTVDVEKIDLMQRLTEQANQPVRK